MMHGVPSEMSVNRFDAGRLMGYFGSGCASTDKESAWKPLRGACVRHLSRI